MPRPTLAFAAVVAAAIAIGFTAKFYFADSHAPGGGFGFSGGPATLTGAPAQSYTVPGLSGKPDSLANYRGKVVLLNLWASWCAPCRSETPALERLYRDDRARGLVVIGVDQGESPAAAAAFAHEMALTYPILVDENQQYGNTYAAVGLPTSLIITRDGHIARGIDGELSLAQMHEAVDPLLRAQ
jgi:peroxiredoxin